MLTTSTDGVWVLQALLGVERMPVALRLKPYIPSAHSDLIVESTAGRVPISATAQYHDLVSAGVIDERGHVDDVVRDWFTVLSRADREVVMTIRRPHDPRTDTSEPTVYERTMVVCRHQRYLAMAARDGEEMVIGGVGEADDPGRQVEAICQMLIPALGDQPPADMEGINVPMAVLKNALDASGGTREGIHSALRGVGLGPWELEIVTAATQLDQSAMAVVVIIDHGAQTQVHSRVFTVADTDYGRVSFTTTSGADGAEWMSMWPTTPVSLRQDLGDFLAAPQLV